MGAQKRHRRGGDRAPPAVPIAAYAAQAQARTGKVVRVDGWLTPVADGPGHYFLLSPAAGARDPASADLAAWPRDFVRVYPKDARRIRAGKVSVSGRLFTGAFTDESTGHTAGAVLIDAVVV